MHIQLVANRIIFFAAASLAVSHAAIAETKNANDEQLRRGEYLANFGGCNDCHTPKIMTANGPVGDKSRLLSGHPASEHLPPVPPGAIGPNQWGAMANQSLTAWTGPWGTSFAANLTPDTATGIGGWSFDQFNKTIRTGKHFGVGRSILPPMPWFDIAVLNDNDMKALFAYLKSLKPIVNPVPSPLPPIQPKQQ